MARFGYVEFLHYCCEYFLQTVHATLALTLLIGQYTYQCLTWCMHKLPTLIKLVWSKKILVMASCILHTVKFKRPYFCQCTQLTCQMTSFNYLLWALFIMFWFHTEMSTCWLAVERMVLPVEWVRGSMWRIAKINPKRGLATKPAFMTVLHTNPSYTAAEPSIAMVHVQRWS